MTHQYADGLRDIVYDVIRILCKLWIAADRKALEAADHRQIIEAVSDGSDAVIHDAEMACGPVQRLCFVDTAGTDVDALTIDGSVDLRELQANLRC